MPEEWRNRDRAIEMTAEERQAVRDIGKLLVGKVPRARW
jgi:hypothetical protein